MTVRRTFGVFTLLAMMHFVVVGTALTCAATSDGARTASSAHTDCAPGTSHSNGGNADRATELPCCAALASCAAAPLSERTVAISDRTPHLKIARAGAERAPRADSPAPELPPPRA